MLISVSVWRSRKDLEEYIQDPLLREINKRRKEYEKNTGILVFLHDDEYNGSLVSDQHESLEGSVRIVESMDPLIEDKVHPITCLEDL